MIDAVFRQMFRQLSPGGRGTRLSILIFHRVLPDGDPLFPDLPDAPQFRRILSWLDAWFDVLPLDRAVRLLAQGRLPARVAALTFDDGYADNATTALPLLAERRMQATFFVTTGFLEGGAMWNDVIIEAIRRCEASTLALDDLGLGAHRLDGPAARRAAIERLLAQLKYLGHAERSEQCQRILERAGVPPPRGLMMNAEQVKELRRAGMQIGAHTVSHPILANLDRESARREIVESKRSLEAIVGEPVRLFAYPNGRPGDDYRDEHVALVREIGFEAAFSTASGPARADSDPMQLPRFTPWERDRFRFGARIAENLLRARASDRAAPSPPGS